MSERDVIQYGIVAQTQTSIALGMSSYREVKIALEQDFNLARTVRGLGTKIVGISLEDQTGPVNADSDNVLVTIYDAFNQIVQEAQEAKTEDATGQYSYAYTPPANASLGIYKAIHSFTISGSASQIEEWFRVVSTLPGAYSGEILRGEEEWQENKNIVNSLGQNVDPDDNDVKYTIRSPRGVVLVENAQAARVGVGQYSASYSPGYNDPLGTYYVSFTYKIDGTQGSAESFFNVAERKNELAVSAYDFKKSPEGKGVESIISDWGDDEIDGALADAQARIESWVGHRVGKHIVTGERQTGRVDSKNHLFAQLKNYPIYKLLNVQLRYHPQVDSLTLPVSAWDVYHEAGQISYRLQAGIPLATQVDNILAENLWQDDVELIIDYEAGEDEVARDVKQAIRVMAAANIKSASGASDIKKVKSGNHEVSYYDEDAGVTQNTSGLRRGEKRALEILRTAGRIPPPIV